MGTAVNFCVDAGGTRCRGRMTDASGDVLAEAESGPCNPATDLPRAADSLTRLWSACAGGLATEAVTLALGGAGLSSPEVRARFLAAIPRFRRAIVMSDGYAALIGAGGGQPCGLIIIGTGVAAHRLFADGRSIERDGWGWIGGDRGSGAWIGQRALRHALAVQDGIVPYDDLAGRVLDTLRTPSLRAGLVGIGPDRLGALAPLVLAAAEAGCAKAARILDGAARHLAALAGTLELDDGVTLFFAGGLAGVMRPRVAALLGRAVAEPVADARTGCLLVATGQAPPETLRESDP